MCLWWEEVSAWAVEIVERKRTQQHQKQCAAADADGVLTLPIDFSILPGAGKLGVVLGKKNRSDMLTKVTATGQAQSAAKGAGWQLKPGQRVVSVQGEPPGEFNSEMKQLVARGGGQLLLRLSMAEEPPARSGLVPGVFKHDFDDEKNCGGKVLCDDYLPKPKAFVEACDGDSRVGSLMHARLAAAHKRWVQTEEKQLGFLVESGEAPDIAHARVLIWLRRKQDTEALYSQAVDALAQVKIVWEEAGKQLQMTQQNMVDKKTLKTASLLEAAGGEYAAHKVEQFRSRACEDIRKRHAFACEQYEIARVAVDA